MSDLHPAALHAVARTRAEGLHLWGRMLGLASVPGDLPRADGEYLLQAAGTDITSLATLTDVGAGFTIRGHLGDQVRLATTSLSLQPTGPAQPLVPGPVICSSRLI